MKLTYKILRILFLLFIVATVTLFSASILLQEKVAEIILGTVNSNITTKIDVGSFHLSLLRKFPMASLYLKNVTVRSSPGLNKASFSEINTDTLLVAETVSIDFKFTDIIRKVYDIERIGIKNGTISLFTDSAGNVNYSITEGKNAADTSNIALNFKRINLSDIRFTYNNLATKLILNGDIKKGRISSRITRGIINLNAEAELLMNGIQQNSIKITNPFNAGLEVKMTDSEKGILFRKGTISVEGFQFGITGSVSAENYLDLLITGENIDLSKLRKYLSSEYTRLMNGYEFAGNLRLNSKITGRLSNTLNPHIEINSNLTNGEINYSKTGITIRNISFTGFYSNGPKNNPESAILTIKDIKAVFGSADYKGSLTMRNLKTPYTDIDFTGRIFPDEIRRYFRIDDISSASGFCDLDIKLKTDFWPEDSITVRDIIKLKPEIHAKFNSFSISLKDTKLAVDDVNGEISLSGNSSAGKLQLFYKGEKIKIDGKFTNLPEWLSRERVRLIADADIYFDKLVPDIFFHGSASGKEKQKKEAAYYMPDDLSFNINLKIDSLKYSKLPSEDLSVSLQYIPGFLTFKSLKMKSLDGIISGDGFVMQNKDKSLITKSNIFVSNINIHKTFKTFRNFGQDFIKAENLEGKLTGSLSLLMPMDSLLNPRYKSLVAEGKYIINNGELIDFEPVKELSSFIELSELENIHFEKLENDFFIRNNFVYIPQMEVNSSAADLSVNGKHSFDNIFEYHVKIRLSELLSKKRKKTHTNNTEFGIVEDDGLGRTSLLLKVESKGDEIKVGYDVKAAGDKVKTSIKSERQTLKTILNQEYGFYKSDTAATQKQPEKKHKFRIAWDENDTINAEPDTSTGKKENVLKNLFKKK